LKTLTKILFAFLISIALDKYFAQCIYPQDNSNFYNKTDVNKADTTGRSSIPEIKKLNMEDFGIGGLVIDRTQSKWGRDFVDLFNKSFNAPVQMNYTILVEEKPLPRFGTVILIKLNGNYIYQKFIQPRYETIKKDAEQASLIAGSYLANYQQIQRELQGDDLKGSGIF